ncbi:phage tail protein [Hahella ganghwensis]|uniref:phage tail protein n=1 Tax=Hahella ganghwensis TaxID=286420 RepID=UPI00037D11D4|nr:phage tail protein [Hahella ganghwensis]
MALAKLQQLTAHLLDRNLVAVEQLDSWMENGTLELADKSLGQGVRICRLKYDAVLTLERYPGDPQTLFAHLVIWLSDHDPDRDREGLAPPDVEVDVNDQDTADIEIRVSFYENIDLVKDDTGDIAFNGESWRLARVPIFEPRAVGVGDDQTQPTDAPYVRED